MTLGINIERICIKNVQAQGKDSDSYRYRSQRTLTRIILAGLLILMIANSSYSQKNDRERITSQQLQPDSIFFIMKKVADWQVNDILNNGWKDSEREWTNAALYTGLLKFAELANYGKYYNFMRENVGEKYNWQLYNTSERYHADYYCVGQMYARFYQIIKDPLIIADLKKLADTLIARPHIESLVFKGTTTKFREWNWCDALFMGPPAIALLSKVTDEIKYMDICDKLWWRTTDYLYDKEEHLFYRDNTAFTEREKNGKKVFWSRGNGWVIAGLVRVLENIPYNYPTKEKWINLYKELADKIKDLQQPDGTWHASLLDPVTFNLKETSGTGFYCYALAWGVNHGLIDPVIYTPVVLRSWKALEGCVHPDGKLGYVQRVGGGPESAAYDATAVYGVGAFLLAGSEVLQISLADHKQKSRLILTNSGPVTKTLEELLSLQNSRSKQNMFYRNILTGEKMSGSSKVESATTIYLKKK